MVLDVQRHGTCPRSLRVLPGCQIFYLHYSTVLLKIQTNSSLLPGQESEKVGTHLTCNSLGMDCFAKHFVLAIRSLPIRRQQQGPQP